LPLGAALWVQVFQLVVGGAPRGLCSSVLRSFTLVDHGEKFVCEIADAV
jgi:hypothetical protein